MFAVIMAGGGGTRLWPRSREHYPKQMHALVGAKPLVQETTETLERIVGRGRVYIITNSHHAQSIESIMPGMAQNILIDPYRRDTAAAIGLAAVYLSRVEPNAVMGVFPSDHYIGSVEEFGRVIHTAERHAAEGKTVTIGIRPTGPETGYGYIELAEALDDGAYQVRRFVEKPSRERAEEYCASGNYLWNSGMFVWSVPTILGHFEKHLPETYARLMRIRDAIGTPDEETVLHEEYKALDRISIDYGIMEKLDDILVIPGDFGWNDIGSWATVAEIAEKDDDGNSAKAAHIAVDTKNCLIMGTDGKVVATVGIEDLIVVDTDDALLICHKDRAQDVKKIVDKLKEGGLEKHL
ncbi:MAG: mannose-1-phosphate guanylyltransferase [Armatimonadota bacterium]